MPPLKIPIVGAGTAGPILALALKRAGHQPVLFDRIDKAGDVGGGINFAANGLRIIKSLGFLDEFERQGMPMVRTEIRKLDGRQVLSFSGKDFEKKYGIPNIAIRRSRMHSLFLQKCQEAGVEIHLRKQLVSVRSAEAGFGVSATFADGSVAEGDFLVGADGLKSAARAFVVGEEAPPRFTGIEAIIGISNSKTEAQAGITRIYQGAGKQVGMYGIGNGTEMLWFVGYPQKQENLVQESWEVDGEGVANREAINMSEIFSGWGLPSDVVEMVARSSRIIRYGIFDRDPTDKWHKGNVLLLGDAAHPMPPHLGQGGNTSLEDAGVLSELVARLLPSTATSPLSHANLETVFKTYTSLRTQRTADITKTAREMGKMNSLENPLLCSLRDSFLALLFWAYGGPPVEAMYGYDYKEVVEKALKK
ncbi:hypothetical protein HDU96_009131 [Phlyctochytrium bullatum]|nr:hypothetical protein HDU96_009131 [Phlyctochytrium bullatum]